MSPKCFLGKLYYYLVCSNTEIYWKNAQHKQMSAEFFKFALDRVLALFETHQKEKDGFKFLMSK